MGTNEPQDVSMEMEPNPGFAERNCGLVVSFTFHFALFFLLYNASGPVTIPPPPKPELIHIALFEEESEPPAALAASEFEPESQIEEPDQTPAEEEADPLTPAPTDPLGEPIEQEALEPEPESEPQESEPEPEEQAEQDSFKQFLEQQRKSIQAENKERMENGSDAIADRLQMASIKLQSQRWLETSRGVDEGMIRKLDTKDVPPEIADRVLARYGIRITYRYINGAPSKYDFLNQASTSEGTFYNRGGKGYYQVFSFGPVAVSKMMRLVTEEMKRQGRPPSRTRVIEVVYGIIETPGRYDLGIKHIELAPVEFRE